MELLAPAGDLQSFYTAVYHGADAVYLGLQTFNARIKADNFSAENIGEIVKFAHLYHVKVYVTINILIKDCEVNDFLDLVRTCVRANVDAFIIQDLGMARLLLANFPHIVLHASTQMGVHNLSGAKFLADFGFKRVVLARETKLADIKLIKQHTNLEIEYFAQGALCVAFSGNCYLSSIKNGNSGNRGKCLQLCRLPYQVYHGSQMVAEGYYLSAKDLCLMKNLQVLADAGVDCLKLEGRLKRAGYVAQVTRSYRQALDNFSSLNVNQEKAKISELFSRGEFNEQAYLYDNFNILNPKISHHQGKKIGKVLATEKFKHIYKITLQLSEAIGQNDALRFVQEKNQFSVGVGNVNDLGHGRVEIFSKQKIPAGCDVFLLKSERKEKVLSDYERHLLVDFYFSAKVGKPAELVVNHGNVTVTVVSENLLEPARTAGITAEQVSKQLSKLNDTKFRLHHLECVVDNVFVAVSVLNDLRRKAIEQLESALIEEYNRELPQVVETKQLGKPVLDLPQKNYYIIEKASDLDGVNLKGFAIIIAPNVYERAYLDDLVGALLRKGIDSQVLYLHLPIVSTEAELELLDEILRHYQFGIVANNYAHLRWVRQYKTIAGLGLNVHNDFTAMTLQQLGCENVIWSLEKQQVANCGSALVSGYPALMTLCHCPVREVYGSNCGNCRYTEQLIYQDEKHNRYRLRRVKIKHCYFELLSEEKYQANVNVGKVYDLRSIACNNMK